MRRHAPDLLAAAGFLAGAAVMILESFSEAYRSTGVGVAQDAVFYPRIVLTIIVVLALLLAVRALRGALGQPAATINGTGPEETATRWLPTLGVILAAFAYAVLLQGAGYLLATVVFVGVTPVVLGFRRWALLAVTTLLFPIASWFLFAKVIGIPLPAGAWWGLG